MMQVQFQNPPLFEVICGVHFLCEPPLRVVDYGLYWDQTGARERFPRVEEQVPLTDLSSGKLVVVGPGTLPRIFFISPEDDTLVQLQGNRLHYNWRRRRADQPYPRFAQIVKSFLAEWQTFTRWNLRQERRLELTRFELTYFNLLTHEHGFDGVASLPSLFRFLCPVTLSPVEKQDWVQQQMQFSLRDGVGELTVNTRPGVMDEHPVLQVDLTARGDAKGDAEAWFTSAHDVIVQSFVDLITDEARQRWGWQG